MHNNTLIVLLLLAVCIVGEESVEYWTYTPLYNDSSVRERTGFLNTDYLGAGYNILRGNPWTLDINTGRDPGWITNRVLSLTYTSGAQTSDGRYYIPDGASIQSIGNCQYGATSTQVFGTRSYYDFLSTYASVSGGSTFGGSFSLSVGYQQTQASTTVSKNVIVQTAASCIVYAASLNPFNTYSYTFSPAFETALSLLPATYDPLNAQPFLDFFNNWGSHVSQQVYMGGRASSVYTFSESAYNDLVSSSIDINAAAGASWGAWSGDATVASSYTTTLTSYFNSKTSSTLRSFLGPPPPVNPSNIANWQNSVINSPFVLSYQLTPISTLVASKYSAKGAALASALNDFCAKTSGCVVTQNLPADPSHPPTVKSCRLCDSCGGQWPVEGGQKVNADDWGQWNAYGPSCGGAYRMTDNQVKLCCGASPTDGTGMCRLCRSCGGAWSRDVGSRLNIDDWGPWNQYSAGCTDPYWGNNWDPPHLCCKLETQCKLCSSCGGGLIETGRQRHVGDWGPWRAYGQGCAAIPFLEQFTNYGENVLCCLP